MGVWLGGGSPFPTEQFSSIPISWERSRMEGKEGKPGPHLSVPAYLSLLLSNHRKIHRNNKTSLLQPERIFHD